MATVTCHIDGPQENAPATIILAHGAGAPMDTPFMNAIANGLAEGGLRVVRFEFPYMSKRRTDGKSRPPDRLPVLRDTWLSVIASVKSDVLVIGGKSMGGRIASLVAEEAQVAGLVCLGYPFHPIGKPDQLRIDHLLHIATPTLILQGDRDRFGSRAEVAEYDLDSRIRMEWLPDGDHSFKPRKSSDITEAENWLTAVNTIKEFVRKLC